MNGQKIFSILHRRGPLQPGLEFEVLTWQICAPGNDGDPSASLEKWLNNTSLDLGNLIITANSKTNSHLSQVFPVLRLSKNLRAPVLLIGTTWVALISGYPCADGPNLNYRNRRGDPSTRIRIFQIYLFDRLRKFSTGPEVSVFFSSVINGSRGPLKNGTKLRVLLMQEMETSAPGTGS